MTWPFNSCLAERMSQFIDFKHLQGYAYEEQTALLARFDRFLCGRHYELTYVTARIVAEYDGQLGPILPQTRRHVLSPVRLFCRFLHSVEPRCEVPSYQSVRRPCAARFYLFTQDQVAALMARAKSLPSATAIRAECMGFLIGLLYTTGLRIGEALALQLRDVQLTGGRLFVRRGKSDKERWVALAPSTVQRIHAWLSVRARYAAEGQREPLLIGRVGQRLTYKQANGAFRWLVRRCGLHNALPAPPRLHDLRHTYACHCIRRWQQDGADVNAKLPILATALGHVTIFETQMYVHVTQTQLREAADRFHRFAFPPPDPENNP